MINMIDKVLRIDAASQEPAPVSVPRPHVEQAGAICYRHMDGRFEMLLIGSRRNGRWGIPKGGIEAGESSHQAARREAFEEAGVRGKVGPVPIGVFHYRKEGKALTFRVRVHLLRVKTIAGKFAEKGQRSSTWASIPRALELTWNDELQTILRGLL